MLHVCIIITKRIIYIRVFNTETILKIYNTLVLPTFYMGQKIGL